MIGRRPGHTWIALNEHYDGDGAIIFKHTYALGCEGIVSKRRGSLYRAGRSDNWLKRCAARRLRPSATLFSFQLFEPGERNG